MQAASAGWARGVSRQQVPSEVAKAPHNLSLGIPGQPPPPRNTLLPPSPWAPNLGGPVYILMGVPNIRAPIRLGKQLSLEDGWGG